MLLHPDEIKKSISTHGWNFLDNKISKFFEFQSYLDGVEFINKIAPIAERLNHHPDINIGYCKVEITISSHDLGGVTTKCINLATSIDSI
jgi:4a-hydroxytetrahydrobiopterin dehydratase|tara:strand:- start:296 stop:565 length:270 start_codon:yes stop_codon:yes gene_type:complete